MSTSLKILIVADTLDVDASSGAKTSLALVESLLACGYDLKILHYSRKEIPIKKATTVAIKEKKTSLYYLLSKAQLLTKRILGISLHRKTEARRGFSYAHTYDVESIKDAISKENPDQYDWVLALSYAGSFRAHTALAQLPNWHRKFIAYIHDPYPQHSYPRPYDWVEPGHQFKRDAFLNISESAKYMMYPSQYLGDWMESYYHNAKGKAIIIPHQIPDVIVGDETPTLFDPNRFNILHAGSMMSARNPMALATAFCELTQDNADFKKEASLIFLGTRSVFHEALETLSKEYTTLYVHPDYMNFEHVLSMQYKASINVVLEAKGAFSPFLPGKVPHCIKANAPILLLSPYKSETRRILGDSYPYWSEIDDVSSIKNHLKEIYTHWKLHKDQLSLGVEDIDALHYYFSPRYIADQFNTLS